MVLSTSASNQGVLVALSSLSRQVNTFINNLSGAYSVSVVQGSNVLTSTVVDVAGVDVPLVYSGTNGAGTVSLKIIALNSGIATVDVAVSKWVTSWTPQTVLV